MLSKIMFEHGETTCAVEPGKFCRFAGSRKFGSEYVCLLFNARLYDQDGWLTRCTECLKEAKSDE